MKGKRMAEERLERIDRRGGDKQRWWTLCDGEDDGQSEGQIIKIMRKNRVR